MRLALAALAWLGGLLMAAQWPALTGRFWAGMAAALAVTAWLLWRQSLDWRPAALAAAACLGGLRLALAAAEPSLTAFHGRSVALSGVVSAPPSWRDDRVQLRVDVDQIFDGSSLYEVDGAALVTVPRTQAAAYGDTVSVAGVLLPPGEFDTFSYTDYLARQGIHSVMREGTLTLLALRSYDDGLALLLQLREAARSTILSALPQPQSGLLVGILLGSEQDIVPSVEQDFQRTGLSHIIAISGFNMAVLSGAVLGLLRPLHQRRPTLAVGAAVLILTSYTVFVGAGPSVLRAAVMCSLLLCAPLVRRRVYLPASAAAAALFLTFLDPFAVWDVGFQLSFAAVLGLALWLPGLQRWSEQWIRDRLRWPPVQQLARSVSDLVSVTVVAQAATLPLLILHFQQVSIVSLMVNLLVLPVQAAVLVFGLLALLLSMIVPVLGALLFALVYVLLVWTTSVVRGFGELPAAAQTVYLSPVWVAAFYFGMVGGHMLSHFYPAWVNLLRQMPLRRAAVGMAVCVLGLAGLALAQRPDGRLHIRWLDSGRSSAVLIQTPQGVQILVDGGRYPNRLMTALGETMPFNDRDIDVLILTQPDDADSAALIEVLRFYRVGLVVSNGQPSASETQAALWELLNGVPHVVATRDMVLSTSDGVHLRVLNPPQTPNLATPLSEGALVLRLVYGERSVLLAGSTHEPPTGDDLELQSDVLHWAAPRFARSIELAMLEAVKPSAVVVQLDRGGMQRYLLDELAAQHTLPLMLRTDKEGAVHLISDGQRWWLQRR
jgi:competence protein ComEC